jgi:hypothetical protein
VRALLGETARLLGAHLYLFTLVSLTVWLPGHVIRNYLEFFEPGPGGPLEAVRLGLMFQVIFDPLVVAATLAALSRIKRELPAGYRVVMTEGLAAWWRLFPVRFVIYLAVLLPTLGAALWRPGSAGTLLAGLALLAAGALIIALVVRFAVIDSVVVLEGATVVTGWRRTAELTRGHRRTILATLGVLVGLTLGFAVGASQLFHAVPGANHFVVRVLFDCALAVSQSLFTIALFLVYWRSRMGALPSAAA